VTADTYFAVKGNQEVALFVQKSAYDLTEAGQANGSGSSNPKALSSIAKVIDGKVELTIGDAFQYGQKNAAGDGRFVVYHNKDNKPFQVS
jgi:hypothetical protein